MLRFPCRFQRLVLSCLLLCQAASARNYTFGELLPCTLNTLQLAQLGPNDHIEPCIIFDVRPNQFAAVEANKSATISIVQVTPSGCGNQRDGTVTGVQSLNNDYGGKGIALGFSEDFYVSFHLTSVVAGNPASLSTQEYERRHVQLLKSMIETLNAPYIVGTCSFAAAIEKQPAREHQAIVMSQVGPPGFYADENPYVFGFHINSDDYPLPAVQSLGFLAAETEEGPAGIPVRIVYRTKSEFFYSTCRSAIDKLKSDGFTDIKEIVYDHSADHDGDGDINQFDEDFLISLADEACPPGSGDEEGFHPALFACTLTEQNVLIARWMENGCRPVSIWNTAATWGWATSNPNIVPYYQGGGQWHEAFDYSDKYFKSGKDLLRHNQGVFGYLGNYDQVVAYAIPVLYAQHLLASYRVEDNPDPVADFQDDERREYLRRDMIVLNVPTIFGQVAFNEQQRNIGRGAAGSQWLPLSSDGSFQNALVAPFLQAEAGTVIPSPGSTKCEAGLFFNESMRVEEGSLLAAACAQCPVNTFTAVASQSVECEPCPEGSSTEGLAGQSVCIKRDDNLISSGILAFGYVASCASYLLSLGFLFWLVSNRQDPVVKVSQSEFLALICVGTLISTSTVVALSFQAGSGEDTTAASIGCAAAPFLYAIGWVVQYSSLSAKTYRLFAIMRGQKQLKRVSVTFLQMFRIVLAALAVDFTILLCWVILSPLEYVRSEESKSIDEETGIVTISTIGRCVSSSDDVGFWAFAGPLVAFHFTLVVVTNVLLYKVREVGDRYQEQKYVGMASMLMFEVLIVGVPVLVSVRDSPAALFIVLTGIVALDDIGILCCIFVPKMLFQQKGLEEGVGFGESIMRESHKRASTRENVRRESSFMHDTSMQFSQAQPSNYGTESRFSTSDDDNNGSGRRDSFTARVSGNNVKSPFGSFGRGNSLADSLVSDSIIEETSEDLKHFESDAESKSSKSSSMSSHKQHSTMGESTSSLRAKKRSLEGQLSNSRIGTTDPNVVSPLHVPSSVSGDSSSNEQQERMLEATKKLMEEHERMMKATALIMGEHERLKQRLEEAQAWKADSDDKPSTEKPEFAPAERTQEEMKQRISASGNWEAGGDTSAVADKRMALGGNALSADRPTPSRLDAQPQQCETTGQVRSQAGAEIKSEALTNKEWTVPTVEQRAESTMHRKETRSERIADTEEESDSSNGAKVEHNGDQNETMVGSDVV